MKTELGHEDIAVVRARKNARDNDARRRIAFYSKRAGISPSEIVAVQNARKRSEKVARKQNYVWNPDNAWIDGQP